MLAVNDRLSLVPTWNRILSLDPERMQMVDTALNRLEQRPGTAARLPTYRLSDPLYVAIQNKQNGTSREPVLRHVRFTKVPKKLH